MLLEQGLSEAAARARISGEPRFRRELSEFDKPNR